MKSFDTFIDSPRKARPDLLSIVLNIVTHPAMAGFTPHGPGSLPTGQSAAAQSEGCPAPQALKAHSHYDPACECFA